MNPVTLSAIATLCLAKADAATSPLVSLAWVTMARSIVAQEHAMQHRVNGLSTLVAIGETVKYFAQARAEKRGPHAPIN